MIAKSVSIDKSERWYKLQNRYPEVEKLRLLYDRPIQISKFVSDCELNAGIRLLNLKNDSLRKRFDAFKYDVKKIEEVVYDLSIRGLRPTQTAE